MSNQPALAPTKAYEYLQRALELLEAPRANHPNSWIRYAEAIDANDHGCSPESDLAVAYCTIGAVRAVTHYDDNPDVAYRYVCSLLDAANPSVLAAGSLPGVNDPAPTFDTVRKLFQRAMTLTQRWL